MRSPFRGRCHCSVLFTVHKLVTRLGGQFLLSFAENLAMLNSMQVSGPVLMSEKPTSPGIPHRNRV